MKHLLIILLLCGLGTSIFAQGNGQYAVQVAAFIESVPTSYFQGLDGIYHTRDQNDIHRYYLGNFSSKSDAEAALATAKNAGYNAQLIDFEEQRRLCANSCAIPVSTPIEEEPDYLESIFFDFDKSFLRTKSKSELDKLYTILMENPGYTTELRAHTDSKGSLEYNVALSQRRADSAQQYLLNRGIAASRVATKIYGEDDPIAKNETNGTDSPEGRQFNRRVQLIVLNASGSEVKIVRDINVPGGLRFSE